EEPECKNCDGLGWSFGADSSHQQTKLITQFHGHEVDTSSCLAFAPKSKHGSGSEQLRASRALGFGVAGLEKWQGYSFHSTELAIDECLTITYSVNVQPVGSFIGGVSVEVMPKKWAEIDTTICWPKKRPSGLDLSILKTEISPPASLLPDPPP
ncbi:unnamed protein product, partial [Symbiodinium necroappetens]